MEIINYYLVTWEPKLGNTMTTAIHAVSKKMAIKKMLCHVKYCGFGGFDETLKEKDIRVEKRIS